MAPGTVVEIGAGLGELLAHIDAPRRFGYDIDPGVVRAARFLHRRGITFVQGDATQVIEMPIDVLILVNWIHNLSPDELSGLLKPLMPRTTHLLLDAIDLDGPSSYCYKHTFDFLNGKAELVSITRAPDEPRSFHLFRVMPLRDVAHPPETVRKGICSIATQGSDGPKGPWAPLAPSCDRLDRLTGRGLGTHAEVPARAPSRPPPQSEFLCRDRLRSRSCRRLSSSRWHRSRRLRTALGASVYGASCDDVALRTRPSVASGAEGGHRQR